jgi:hypothetical protein
LSSRDMSTVNISLAHAGARSNHFIAEALGVPLLATASA